MAVCRERLLRSSKKHGRPAISRERARQRITAEHGERWFRIWQFFLAWSQLVAEQGSAACFQVVLNKNLDSLDRRGI